MFIQSRGNITNKISADKFEYGANEAVNITEIIKNTSLNSIASNLIVKTSITDSDGMEIWNHSNIIEEIIQNSNQEITSNWNTLQSIPGEYIIKSEVYNNEELITQSETLIKITSSTSEENIGITGKLYILTKNIKKKDKEDKN